MIGLWKCFWGYIEISWPRLGWVFLFTAVFFFFFVGLQKICNQELQRRNTRSIFYMIMLSMACSFVFVMTLFGRKIYNYDFELQIFKSYLLTIQERDVGLFLQIIMNVFMYVPVGFWLPCCFKVFSKKRLVIFFAFISSLTIELIQGFGKMGVFETDDIVSNVLGASIGVLLFRLVIQVKTMVIVKNKDKLP